MKSPLDFLTDAQWAKLCKKYNVPQSFKPRKLGSGISAVAYTFGKKLVIKETDCYTTIDVAKRIKNKNIQAVAKVFEISKTRKVGYRNAYYIIQEFVPKRTNSKSQNFAYDFADIAGTLGRLDKKTLDFYISTAIQLKQCGIDCSNISDLHSDNVFATKNGVKIVDLGCLDFG